MGRLPRRQSSRTLLLRITLFVAALACAAFARADEARWTPVGPGGGAVFSLAIDPGNPEAVYAVAAGSRYQSAGMLYHSTDGGVTWETLAGPGLEVVAIEPGHPSTVYAGGSKVLRSTDGGRAWSEVTPPGSSVVQTLAVAPGGVVLAAEGPRLWRSANGGETWSVVSQDEVDIRSIVIDPVDPRRMYHASWSQIYKSTDGGEHWTVAASPVSDDIGSLAVAPSAPATLYLVLVGLPEVFRSDDGAASWRQVGWVPAYDGFPTLLVDPRSRERIYEANLGGIFTSGDGGNTWSEIGASLPRPFREALPIYSLAIAGSRPDTLYAGTYGWGVAKSASAGARWRIGVEPGLNAGAVGFFKFHPSEPDTIYLGFADGGTRSFRSTDGGRSWQPFARSIAEYGLNDLAFDPGRADTLYAGAGNGLWKSADGGGTWQKVASKAFRLVASVGAGKLLAGDCGLSRSTNGGRTWKQVIACSDGDEDSRRPEALWVDPTNPATAYAHFFVGNGSSHQGYQVFKSEDGGVTWKSLRIPGYLSRQFAVAPSDFRVLYAIDRAVFRLLRSEDGGKRWKVVRPDLPPGIDVMYGSMAVDAADPYSLYIGGANGLFVSHDGGATLERIDEPLEASKRDTGRVWTDRTRPGLVYAGPFYGGGGLFVRRID